MSESEQTQDVHLMPVTNGNGASPDTIPLPPEDAARLRKLADHQEKVKAEYGAFCAQFRMKEQQYLQAIAQSAQKMQDRAGEIVESLGIPLDGSAGQWNLDPITMVVRRVG